MEESLTVIIDPVLVTKCGKMSASSYSRSTELQVPWIGDYAESTLRTFVSQSIYRSGYSCDYTDLEKSTLRTFYLSPDKYQITDSYQDCLPTKISSVTSYTDLEHLKLLTALRVLHDPNSPYNSCVITTQKSPDEIKLFLKTYQESLAKCCEATNALEHNPQYSVATIQLAFYDKTTFSPGLFFSGLFEANTQQKKLYIFNAQPTMQKYLKKSVPKPTVKAQPTKTNYEKLTDIKNRPMITNIILCGITSIGIIVMACLFKMGYYVQK